MRAVNILIILITLAFVCLFLSSESLAFDSLSDITKDYQAERYVILEKLKCSNNEVIERYVRIYEKSPQGQEGNQQMITKGRTLKESENNIAYLLENYIEIEGVYYRPLLESLSDRYEVDSSTCPGQGYKISIWEFALEKKNTIKLQNLRLSSRTTSTSLFTPAQESYQLTRYSFKGVELGSEVAINDYEYASQNKDEPNIIKDFSALTDTDQLTNTYTIKVASYAYKAGKPISQYELGQEQPETERTARSIRKNVSVYELDKRLCYELGDCCGNGQCNDYNTGENETTCPEDCKATCTQDSCPAKYDQVDLGKSTLKGIAVEKLTKENEAGRPELPPQGSCCVCYYYDNPMDPLMSAKSKDDCAYIEKSGRCIHYASAVANNVSDVNPSPPVSGGVSLPEMCSGNIYGYYTGHGKPEDGSVILNIAYNLCVESDCNVVFQHLGCLPMANWERVAKKLDEIRKDLSKDCTIIGNENVTYSFPGRSLTSSGWQYTSTVHITAKIGCKTCVEFPPCHDLRQPGGTTIKGLIGQACVGSIQKCYRATCQDLGKEKKILTCYYQYFWSHPSDFIWVENLPEKNDCDNICSSTEECYQKYPSADKRCIECNKQKECVSTKAEIRDEGPKVCNEKFIAEKVKCLAPEDCYPSRGDEGCTYCYRGNLGRSSFFCAPITRNNTSCTKNGQPGRCDGKGFCIPTSAPTPTPIPTSTPEPRPTPPSPGTGIGTGTGRDRGTGAGTGTGTGTTTGTGTGSGLGSGSSSGSGSGPGSGNGSGSGTGTGRGTGTGTGTGSGSGTSTGTGTGRGTGTGTGAGTSTGTGTGTGSGSGSGPGSGSGSGAGPGTGAGTGTGTSLCERGYSVCNNRDGSFADCCQDGSTCCRCNSDGSCACSCPGCDDGTGTGTGTGIDSSPSPSPSPS